MTVQELIDALTAQVEADPYRKDAAVTFGENREPVEGGLFGRNPEKQLVELNLAPLKLDRIGGF
jgi:hypothetical protein